MTIIEKRSGFEPCVSACRNALLGASIGLEVLGRCQETARPRYTPHSKRHCPKRRFVTAAQSYAVCGRVPCTRVAFSSEVSHMMHNFLANNRSELIDRCRMKVAKRPERRATAGQLQDGVPTFLDQLIRTLRIEQSLDPMESRKISGSSDGTLPTNAMLLSW